MFDVTGAELRKDEYIVLGRETESKPFSTILNTCIFNIIIHTSGESMPILHTEIWKNFNQFVRAAGNIKYTR